MNPEKGVVFSPNRDKGTGSGTSLMRCFALINDLACVPEVELFYDQVVLLQLFQGISYGPRSKVTLAHNLFMGHGAPGLEQGQDGYRRLG